MTMISLGGVIGAGLFVGSSAVISETGPASVLSYLTYFAIAAMVSVIAAMALVEDVRAQLIPSFISLAVVLAAYWFKTSAERRSAAVPAGAAYPRAGSLGRVLRRMHDENVAR